MKKLSLILFVTLLFVGRPTLVVAATPRVDSVQIYNEKNELVFMQEWQYDDNGQKTNEVQYTWTNGVKHGDQNMFQAFDDKKNLVEDVKLIWSDAQQEWLGDSRTEKIFNAANKEAMGLHFGWKEEQWVSDSTWTYEYDAQGRPTLTLYQNCHNGQWREQYKLIQRYDASREIYHEEYEGRTADGLKGKSKWQKMYNGSTLISDRRYAWSGTAFEPTSWDTTGIVEGKTTLKMSYIWTDGEQIGKSKEEWEFDGSHQTLYITYSGWENGAFVPSTKQEDAWSGSTNIMTAKYNWDKEKGQWIGTTKTENITSNGYSIKKTYSGWANDDFVPATIDSTKKENGKQVYYAKWVTSDGKTWTGSTKMVYAFDGAVQILSEIYSQWNNGWIGSDGNKWEQICKEGKVWSKVTYNWSSGWVPIVKDSTEYEGNDITFSVHYTWTGSAWEGDNTKTNFSRTYLSGNKEWETTLKWENNQWTNVIQTRLIYEGGKIKEERSQQWSGTAWVDVKVVYHTWENGVEVFTRTEEWDNEAQKLKMTKQAKHEIIKQDSKIVEEAYYECLSDSVWYGVKPWRTTWETYMTDTTLVDAKITYSWDKKSTDWINKSKSETITGINDLKDLYSATASYTWSSDEGWVLGSSHEKWIDHKGRMIKEKDSKCEYGFCRDNYVYEDAYDDGDRLILSSQLNGSTGNRTEYNYDESGNMTLIRYSTWNDALEDWLATSEEVYQYDDQNRKTDFEKTTQQAGTGILVKTQKEHYEYNGSEKKAYSTLKYEYVILEGEEVDRWVVKQEDTYKYDNDDSSDLLREEIHGTWSKGVVIQYERKVYFYSTDPK